MALICAQPALATITQDSGGNLNVSGQNEAQITTKSGSNQFNNDKTLTVSGGATLSYSGGNTILVTAGASPTKIENNGSITAGKTAAIRVEKGNGNKGSKLQTIDNKGTIQGVADGIIVAGNGTTVTTITNASGATIEGTGTYIGGFGDYYNSAATQSGISVRNRGKIETIENEGTIKPEFICLGTRITLSFT